MIRLPSIASFLSMCNTVNVYILDVYDPATRELAKKVGMVVVSVK